MLGLRSVGPQQIELARLLLAEIDDAPEWSEFAVTEPRRASKTTTIWAVLLGLCQTRPGFKVVVTAQTYVKARERFLEVARTLGPRNVGDYRILRGAAAEAIEWTNGSRLWVVTPEGGAFRGDGADRILFDEAQEHSPETTADLLGGALALMDTRFDEDADLTSDDVRPAGQVIITGTAGKARSGMLWDALERGRRGKVGVLEYAVPDGTPVAWPVDEAPAELPHPRTLDKSGRYVLNEAAIEAAHPGIGTLTTMRVVRERFAGMGLAQFQREYGGQWPFDVNTRAIDPAEWKAGQRRVTGYPARWAIGFDVAPDQSAAALCAAWRDQSGRAWVEVIDHQVGDSWLPAAVFARSRKHPGLPVGYDNIGPNQAVADRLTREARPRPKLVQLGTRDITAAASQVAQDIRSGNLAHPVDPALDDAADVATRRPIGDGSWAWGRRRAMAEGGDITTLVAATNALRVYDTLLARAATRERPRVISVTG
ncbi:MAG: hypothetical protein KJ792_02750 [Actinobacteria bacterium]|nr:hypothetical protein [Actinomycetota bacterium]MCG2800484.1 hypothetical protein [Cellulomonas sp.]